MHMSIVFQLYIVNLLTFCISQLDVVESVEVASACHGVVVSFVGEVSG